MIKKNVRVKKWISCSDIKEYSECPADIYHFDALIKELIDNKYIICGDTHQCSDFVGIPVFDDGYLLLSMRRWREIMEEAWKLMYPDKEIPNFYMASLCSIEENLPCETL